MQTASSQLQNAVQSALESVCREQFPDFDVSQLPPNVARVEPCANANFGDYQWNGALGLAKQLRTNPRQLAQHLTSKIDVSVLSEAPEIAGPGFVNFRLKTDWVQNQVAQVLADPRSGVPVSENPKTVVVDYPSPNVAKPLHVGHIRTTFIGDAIARTLRFAGHKVIADNHIGDWGTPIGKVIVGWKTHLDRENFARSPLEEMGRIYKIVDTEAKNDPAKRDLAREETAKLHAGDAENLRIWQQLRDASEPELNAMYQRLDVHLDVTLGESFYHERLPGIVRELQERGLAQPSQGAIVISFEEPPHLRDKPMLIQKSDGSFLYATTDLATIQYRMETWSPDEIVYVVDVRQSDHFRQLFAAVRMWGFDEVELKHVTFGTILGEDGTPIKTREGDPPKLGDLLDEAERRALAIVQEKNPDLTPEAQKEVARVVGIGALKYGDLAQNRTGDYTFSWDKMLAMQGNSAPYLLFAYVRTRAIFRRAGLDAAAVQNLSASTCTLEQPQEIALAKLLLRFHEPIETALQDYRLNAISDYLFELAQTFSAFIEACRVLDAPEPARTSRLMLCALTSNVLKQGLELLGIETIEQM